MLKREKITQNHEYQETGITEILVRSCLPFLLSAEGSDLSIASAVVVQTKGKPRPSLCLGAKDPR